MPKLHALHWAPRSAALLAVGLLLCVSSHATDWALPELMNIMAQQKSASASFVEKKYIGFLDVPLESSGELSFEAPNRLEKRTLKPHAESMLLDGDKLTVAMHEKKPLNLRLQDQPVVAAMVESIRGTLSGDRAALEKNYSVEFSGVPAKWQLTLTPVNRAVTKIVRQIQIGGADGSIKTIRFDQTDGDRMEMVISKTVTP